MAVFALPLILGLTGLGGALGGRSLLAGQARKAGERDRASFGNTLAALGPSGIINQVTGREMQGPLPAGEMNAGMLSAPQVRAVGNMADIDIKEAKSLLTTMLTDNRQAAGQLLTADNNARGWQTLEMQQGQNRLKLRELNLLGQELEAAAATAMAKDGLRPIVDANNKIIDAVPIRRTDPWNLGLTRLRGEDAQLTQVNRLVDSMLTFGGIMSPDHPAFQDQQFGITALQGLARKELNFGTPTGSELAIIENLIANPTELLNQMIRGDAATLAGVSQLMSKFITSGEQAQRDTKDWEFDKEDTSRMDSTLSRSEELHRILQGSLVLNQSSGAVNVQQSATLMGFRPSAQNQALLEALRDPARDTLTPMLRGLGRQVPASFLDIIQGGLSPLSRIFQ